MRPKRYRRLRRVLDRRQPDLTVLMERVHKSHNFSAILRNCDAVGVLETHVIPPEGGLDVHRSASAGTGKWVGVREHPNLDAALEALGSGGFQVVAAHPAADALDYRELDYTGPTCLLVGAELHGLSREALARADHRVAVPMVGMVRSLNVSVAASLLLFEAFRQRDAAGMYDQRRLDAERYRRLLFEWAHPRVARTYRAEGRPYPDLDDEGEIQAP